MDLDYETKTYLAVTFSPSSQFLNNPALLATYVRDVNHVGPIGQLPDIQLFSVEKDKWNNGHENILSAVKEVDGVARVDVQALQQRRKRDEL